MRDQIVRLQKLALMDQCRTIIIPNKPLSGWEACLVGKPHKMNTLDWDLDHTSTNCSCIHLFFPKPSMPQEL